VDVPRQHVPVRKLDRVMAKYERRIDERRVDARDFHFSWRIAGVAVVVSAHQ